jgi:hypothetical protein
MTESWTRALVARRREIRQRWEALLRLERTRSPMADPDNLIHLIDWTLDQVFGELRNRKAPHRGGSFPRIAALRAPCACGRNPYLDHFLAGEQALIEALVLAQAREPSLDPEHRETAVAELYLALHQVAKREVESVCSICPRAKAQGPPAAFASCH